MSSSNKFYVQTSSGFRSVAGCSYGGYVPLWANIASSDNFTFTSGIQGKPALREMVGLDLAGLEEGMV